MKLGLVLAILLIGLVSVTMVYAQFTTSGLEMIGTVATEVVPIQLADENLNAFNMTVLSANDTAPLNENITVVLSTLITPPQLLARVNVTGLWDEGFQVFRASTVQTVGDTDWLKYIKEAIAMISSVMRSIANVIASLIAMATGYSINPVLITVILEALFVVSIIKWYKTIGLFLILAVIFLMLSGGLQILQLFLP
jgi:glutaredoxin 2